VAEEQAAADAARARVVEVDKELDRVRALGKMREVEAVMDAAGHAEAKARLEATVESLREVRGGEGGSEAGEA